MDAAALSSLDPFQDISTLPGNDDDDNDDDDDDNDDDDDDDDDNDTSGISDIVNVPVQVKEGFVKTLLSMTMTMKTTMRRRKMMMILSSVETLLTLLLMMKNRLINL